MSLQIKVCLIIAVVCCFQACGIIHKRVFEGRDKDPILANGVPWFDDRGEIVNAHGACLVEEGGKFYLFGEFKTDSANRFNGFGCYSSTNLVDWKFEKIVLPVQKEGLLGPDRIGERVKVMRCPSTGEFVMFMHTDNLGYMDPSIGYATSKKINGEYEFKGALKYRNHPIKKWDMGTFQDSDGAGYLLIHHGEIYKLAKDYLSAEELMVSNIPGSGESPAMFRKNGTYYLLGSGLTSWERNDNFYFTAKSIRGPWKKEGTFTPKGTLTFNSQSSFVFPMKIGNDTTFLFMGDRWSFPKQATSATYMWMPITIADNKMTIPQYWSSWNVKRIERADYIFSSQATERAINFRSNIKNSLKEFSFDGSQIALYGKTDSLGGYGRITIKDKRDNIVTDVIIDFYSKVPDDGVRFVSPVLPSGKYNLRIEVTGENSVWSNKAKTIFYGSKDKFVDVQKAILK